MSASGECYGFIAEWFDPSPQIKRRYLLKYFPAEHQIEMIDMKLKRSFLKRGPAPANVLPSQFYVGGQVILHSRALAIIDYADPYTRGKLAPASETAALFITPDAYHHCGKIIEELSAAGFTLKHLKMLRLNGPEASELCHLLEGGGGGGGYGGGEQTAKLLCSGPVVALGVMAPGAVELLAQCVADLKARYATNDIEQALAGARGHVLFLHACPVGCGGGGGGGGGRRMWGGGRGCWGLCG